MQKKNGVAQVKRIKLMRKKIIMHDFAYGNIHLDKKIIPFFIYSFFSLKFRNINNKF